MNKNVQDEDAFVHNKQKKTKSLKPLPATQYKRLSKY